MRLGQRNLLNPVARWALMSSSQEASASLLGRGGLPRMQGLYGEDLALLIAVPSCQPALLMGFQA